ncbi:hypothetical protein BKA61DRAFT_663953 [Leptodontidium sp. MPI-SDFR-AT-0119]|nr:hypothetical protein BKA61DRAFT_663953 [Leptodontidium sp. MPI-SDFR-AT-0119]
MNVREKNKGLESSYSDGIDRKILHKEGAKDLDSRHSILLVVDLNSRNPVAAFTAPSLGYPKAVFIPALKMMSKMTEKSLLGTDSGHFKPAASYADIDWTTKFLSCCRTHLKSAISIPLEDVIMEFSFTARSDVSDRSKAMLVEAIRAADFKVRTEDVVQIIPSIEAVTIDTVRCLLATHSDSPPLRHDLKPRMKYHILVLHYDGDVAEIQSYSVSGDPRTKSDISKSDTPGFRLKELVYGQTVDHGKLIDYHFKHWLKEHHPTLNPSTPKDRTDGGLLDDFASLRRTYNPGQKDWHHFSVAKQVRKDKSETQISELWIEDKHMNQFFGQATDSLIQNLDDHHDRVSQIRNSFDEVIYGGPKGSSRYVEAALKDWGIGNGIINTDCSPGVLLVSMQNMIIRGAVHGSYAGVEVVARSRAHYGYVLAAPFQDGDPEWSRTEDPWDNTDRCEVYVSWHVRKNQLLDSHANITQNASQVLTTGGRLRGQLNLYRCELDEPPRWTRTHQDTPDPNMHFVGSVNFEFTEADFPGAERKVCEDGIQRRLFPVRIKVMCGHYTRTLRVTVTSPDGRHLGRAALRYE